MADGDRSSHPTYRRLSPPRDTSTPSTSRGGMYIISLLLHFGLRCMGLQCTDTVLIFVEGSTFVLPQCTEAPI